MTHQAPPAPSPAGADPGRRIAQLREALRLVETIAGLPAAASPDAALDEAARVSAAYDRALPILQRRFDTRAAEAASWAAAGVEALLAAQGEGGAGAAARRLSRQLERELGELTALL
jgi:hypothetical protein